MQAERSVLCRPDPWQETLLEKQGLSARFRAIRGPLFERPAVAPMIAIGQSPIATR
jgi:hypothetical protein